MNGHNNNKIAQKCIIYWDYENCPVPGRATSFGNVNDMIKRRLFAYLPHEVTVESRVYIAARKVPPKTRREMDICGVKNIDIPSWKPEAVDKRMLVDLALDLYGWKGHNICNAVVLITGDKDFGNILARIHNAAEIAKLILLRLPNDDGFENPVNKNLYSTVDYIIDSNHGNGFKVEEFIDCKHGFNCNRKSGECLYYHHRQQLQSPTSSISNMSASNGQQPNGFNNDEQKQMSPKTLEIRKKTPCRFGNKCKNWKNGECHYYHPHPFKSPQLLDIGHNGNNGQYPNHQYNANGRNNNNNHQNEPFDPNNYSHYNNHGRPQNNQYNNYNNNSNKKPCKFGNKCSFWKKGTCRNFHPFPYAAPSNVQPPPNPFQQQLQPQPMDINHFSQQPPMMNPGAVGGDVGFGAPVNYVPLQQNDQLIQGTNILSYEKLIAKEFGGIEVDRSKLESYLSDAEFKQYFNNQTKSEFYAQPPWKQRKMKKSVGLF